MKSMIGLLVVVVIVILVYQFYFSKGQSSGVETPAQTINIVGVKNDLVGIAQAERAYQAEHGSYASLNDLTSSGSLTMQNRSRQGYTYDIETSALGFRAVAHCPATTNPGCENYFVDQTMEVQRLP
jgi:competence protein ComGC